MDHTAPGARLVYCPEEPEGREVTGHFEEREIKGQVAWLVTCPRELEGSPGS